MARLKNTRIVIMAVLVVALVLFIPRMDPRKIGNAFMEADWRWATWVVLLNLVNTYLEAVRLALTLSPFKEGTRIRKAFDSILVGVLWNTVLPFRIGDGVRIYFLAKAEKVSLTSSISAVMVDRVADLILFFVMMVSTALVFPFPSSVNRMGLLPLSLLCLGMAALFGLMKFNRRLGDKFCKTWGARSIRAAMNHLTMALSVLRKTGLLVPIGFLSALSWMTRVLMVWVMFEAFHLSLPFIAAPVVLILTNLGIAAVNTPANLGSFEVCTVAALKLFSIDAELALSYGIALHLVEVIPMMLPGLLVLWFSDFKSKEALTTYRAVSDKLLEHDAAERCN
jgi:uncharacterized protein (TIRG00374 family)